MRVTHVITRLIVGGAQENTLASVFGLQRRPDLAIDLIAGPTTGEEGSLEPLARSVPGLLTVIPELIRPVAPWSDLIAFLKLRRLFRKKRPHIVHTHSGKAGFVGRLAASRAGVPVIIHTIHGPSFGPFQKKLANTVFRQAERIAGRVTTHFVVVADSLKDQYLGAGIGIPSQYSLIYSGFDIRPYFEARPDPLLIQKLGLRPDDLVVGMIARLFALKGHDDLLGVAPGLSKRCPNLRFLLVGDGPWRKRLEHEVRSAQLQDKVIFAGLVPPAEVPGLVALMDMVVHLSRREGLPRALPQALAAGRPVIAYDCDGAREVCREGETGYLVAPGDLQTLADRILSLAHDPQLRLRLGTTGQRWVTERFSEERMVDELYRLYRRYWSDDHSQAAMPK